MTFSRTSTLATLLLLALAGITRAQTTPAGNPPPTKLAVVNVVELFDGLLEKADADGKVDQMKRDFEAKSNKMTDDITALQKGMAGGYKPGTDEFRKAQDDLLQKTMDLQSFNAFAQQKLFLELRIRTADIYRKINEAVAKYAVANGIALVFVADNASVEGARTQEQLQAMVTVRKILYFHPDFDITGKIKQAMNTEFELGKP